MKIFIAILSCTASFIVASAAHAQDENTSKELQISTQISTPSSAANALPPQPAGNQDSDTSTLPPSNATVNNPPPPPPADGDDDMPPPPPQPQNMADNAEKPEQENAQNTQNAPQIPEIPASTEPQNAQQNAADSAEQTQQVKNTTPNETSTEDLKENTKDSNQEQAPDTFSQTVQKLFERNPFGTGNGSYGANGEQQTSAVPEAPKGIELRSIYCVDGKWFFSVADTKLKSSYTIPLGGQITDKLPYAIDFYDDETNSISISNELGTYTLTLKEQDKPSGQTVNMIPTGKNNAPAGNKVQTAQIRNLNNAQQQNANRNVNYGNVGNNANRRNTR